MIIKVCGITKVEQMQLLDSMKIDMVGLNFYVKSKRFIGNTKLLKKPLKFSKKVGIFVNAGISQILEATQNFNLDFAQLHGLSETPDMCMLLQKKGLKIIKVFSDKQVFNSPKMLEPYNSYVDYFLIDKHHSYYGGGGQTFDWSRLENIPFSKPFLLSGGISSKLLQDIFLLKKNSPSLIGVDINSKFELFAGVKNTTLIASFQKQLKGG